MTILEFAKTYGLDVEKLTQAIDNLKTIRMINTEIRQSLTGEIRKSRERQKRRTKDVR